MTSEPIRTCWITEAELDEFDGARVGELPRPVLLLLALRMRLLLLGDAQRLLRREVLQLLGAELGGGLEDGNLSCRAGP